jgi:hypothetical protein
MGAMPPGLPSTKTSLVACLIKFAVAVKMEVSIYNASESYFQLIGVPDYPLRFRRQKKPIFCSLSH